MSFILKLSAYTFLALIGLWAWNTLQEGWRYYLGIVFFVVCVLRILMILRQRMNKKAAPRDSNAQPSQNQTETNETANTTPTGQ